MSRLAIRWQRDLEPVGSPKRPKGHLLGTLLIAGRQRHRVDGGMSFLDGLRIKKITPLPSPLEYHCRILPSRYSFTVARTSAGMTFRICCRVTPSLAVRMTITSVVLGDGGLEGGWPDGN